MTVLFLDDNDFRLGVMTTPIAIVIAVPVPVAGLDDDGLGLRRRGDRERQRQTESRQRGKSNNNLSHKILHSADDDHRSLGNVSQVE